MNLALEPVSNWGTIAGLLTALFTLLTAIGGLIVTFKVMVPNFKVNNATHKIVNQEKTNRDNFNRALIRALDDAGIKVPIDQSLPVEEGGKKDGVGT